MYIVLETGLGSLKRPIFSRGPAANKVLVHRTPCKRVAMGLVSIYRNFVPNTEYTVGRYANLYVQIFISDRLFLL